MKTFRELIEEQEFLSEAKDGFSQNELYSMISKYNLGDILNQVSIAHYTDPKSYDHSVFITKEKHMKSFSDALFNRIVMGAVKNELITPDASKRAKKLFDEIGKRMNSMFTTIHIMDSHDGPLTVFAKIGTKVEKEFQAKAIKPKAPKIKTNDLTPISNEGDFIDWLLRAREEK